MSVIISGAAIIDGIAEGPIHGCSIWIEGSRIKAIVGRGEFSIPPGADIIDARGKYVIPGLMNANVHLLSDTRIENLARYEDRLEDLIAEAAQVALKNGLTTVFDTHGPRRALMSVRDKINARELPGSRIFCAGNIIGLDGPYSQDFLPKSSEVASNTFVERINAIWTENVGPALSWMTPEQVANEVRTYIRKGIDFIKYASSEHRWGDRTTFLVFSPQAQAAMIEEAHCAGITAQAHASSVESLRVAIEAGCDLIQHCNITGPFPIPEGTLDLMAKRKTGAVVFPFTQRRFDWVMANCELDRVYFSASDANCRNLLQAGAMLLLANDGLLLGSDLGTDHLLSKSWIVPGEDNLNALDEGHFVWMKAMEEKGMAPIEMLRAATRNIAIAYGKDKELGTLENGKIADLLILDKNPLEAAENYRSICVILKEGIVVDRDALPLRPMLTRPVALPPEETLAYRAHRSIGRTGFSVCPMCAWR